MALIVRAQRRGPAVIRGEVHTAQQEAAALLAAASCEAERILARAEADAHELREAAAQERASARAPIREERARAQAAIEAERSRARAALDEERTRVLADAERRGLAESHARSARELIELAAARSRALATIERDAQRAILLVATKLLAGALETDPERIAGLIDPLLARVRRAESVRIRLHPEDARALEPRLCELRARAELEGSLVLVSDPGLERGGCVVESDLGELDARLETRVTLLARALGWEYP
jgi:flagellar biosynthesis/type III secretory pathway protein FliH